MLGLEFGLGLGLGLEFEFGLGLGLGLGLVLVLGLGLGLEFGGLTMSPLALAMTTILAALGMVARAIFPRRRSRP